MNGAELYALELIQRRFKEASETAKEAAGRLRKEAEGMSAAENPGEQDAERENLYLRAAACDGEDTAYWLCAYEIEKFLKHVGGQL